LVEVFDLILFINDDLVSEDLSSFCPAAANAFLLHRLSGFVRPEQPQNGSPPELTSIPEAPSVRRPGSLRVAAVFRAEL
jgi:hypothetical protein